MELLSGDEVMGHVPVVQPMNLQYKNPPAMPTITPKNVIQCLLKNVLAICLFNLFLL